MAQQIVGPIVRGLAKAAMKKKAKSSMAKKAAVAAGASNETRSVKKVPRKTAPSTGLENRGARPTSAQRKERAADLSFKKAEGRYEGEYLTIMTGLKGPKGVTSQRTRGQGTRSLRKEAAVNKEAKRKVINSQQNLSKAQKSGANKKALKAANRPRRRRGK